MRLARRARPRWDEVNATPRRPDPRARSTAHGGAIVRTEGDAVFARLPGGRRRGRRRSRRTARAGRRAMAGRRRAIRVRMGLHTGEAHLAGDDYGGFDVNRAARVAAAGHGGQVVLSETTASLVEDALPDGTSLRDLGRHILRDVPRAERLYQLDIAGLRDGLPAAADARPRRRATCPNG